MNACMSNNDLQILKSAKDSHRKVELHSEFVCVNNSIFIIYAQCGLSQFFLTKV